MKRVILLIFSFLTVSFLQAQSDNGPKSGPVINFEESSFDFGDITQGDTVKHAFKFTNTGNAPLILSEVLTTCGCTAPSWTKEPIMPGKTGDIMVRYNSSGKQGIQNKVITVLSNAVNSPQSSPARVSIRVNVLPPKN